MKNTTLIFTAMFALSVTGELLAQTRGPRYNPGGGGGSRSSSSGGGMRSSSSSGGARSSASSNRGPRYNPGRSSGSSSSSRGSSYNPGRVSSSNSTSSNRTSSTGPVDRGPRYNPNPARSTVSSTGGIQVPRGPRYNPTPGAPKLPPHLNGGQVLVRRVITHVPRQVVYTGTVRYSTPHDYYARANRQHIYRSWMHEPVAWHYGNGYWDIDGYPYYVHRGFRYRYNPIELCQYELVDSENYTTVRRYPLEACSTAYDICATERDGMNSSASSERYYCAERVDDDLAQKPTEVFQPSLMVLTEVQKTSIDALLDDMDFEEVFEAGREQVGSCSIEKNGGLFSRGNSFGCRWTVYVGDNTYPLTDGSVCSGDSAAEAVGCNIGNEKENAGCILQQAIQSGLCLESI